MSVDHTRAMGGVDGGEVMAAFDEDGDRRRLVLADVSRDEAWLSTRAGCAAALSEWR